MLVVVERRLVMVVEVVARHYLHVHRRNRVAGELKILNPAVVVQHHAVLHHHHHVHRRNCVAGELKIRNRAVAVVVPDLHLAVEQRKRQDLALAQRRVMIIMNTIKRKRVPVAVTAAAKARYQVLLRQPLLQTEEAVVQVKKAQIHLEVVVQR